MHKVIAGISKVYDEEDVYLKCEGLVTLIYEYGLNYDYYLIERDKYNEIKCAQAIDVLTFFINERLPRLTPKHRCTLIGFIQSCCLRILQQAKSDKVKQTARDIFELYGKIAKEQ